MSSGCSTRCATWQAAGVASPMTVTNSWAKSLWDWLADFPAQVQIAVSPGAVTNMIAALFRSIPIAQSRPMREAAFCVRLFKITALTPTLSQRERARHRPTRPSLKQTEGQSATE